LGSGAWHTWRPEISTFHLRVREMTVTLQDMALLLGLYINDSLVAGTNDKDCAQECKKLLAREPPPTTTRGGALKLKWHLNSSAWLR